MAGCLVPKIVGSAPFLDMGVFALFARTAPRELITHTPQMNDKIQRIIEIFYVKTPVILSKSICAYPPL